jgi:2-polyprenyl-3-methyl-5-hydroxy-6-metoxy-1,4-benzoquinol methylase
MKPLDILLQRWRISKVKPWIPDEARILDLGCYQGELFESLDMRTGPSLGIDPLVAAKHNGHVVLLPWKFSEPMPLAASSFDVITLLATFEHLQDKRSVVRECYRLLEAGGLVVLTVPSPLVDVILSALVKLRMIDGMSLEEHHGYNPELTPGYFINHGFHMKALERFQLGFNYLYVFQKPTSAHPGGYSIPDHNTSMMGHRPMPESRAN